MSSIEYIDPVFVDVIPFEIEPGILYISEQFETAVHLCASGCGRKVVTPLKSARWRILVDDGKVSLSPSIGNWNFPCKSHYWIRKNKIVWARSFSKAEIDFVRAKDERDLINVHVANKGIFYRLGVWIKNWFG